MKYAKCLLVGVGLLLIAGGAGAAPVVVLSDDAESEAVGSDPVADIGSYRDASGEVTDAATEGIADNPNNTGSRFIEITRALGGSGIIAGTATDGANLGTAVHLEFDMYVVDKGSDSTYADFLVMESKDCGACEGGVGHPSTGQAPHIRVRYGGFGGGEVYHMYAAPAGTWNVESLGLAASLDAWHLYEIDLVVGSYNSMFITVDGGTPVNIPTPWGFSGYGDTVNDPDAREEHDETWGIVFRPAGGNAQYYFDNLSMTIDIPVLGFVDFDVATSRMLELQTASNVVYRLESAVPPATSVWTAVGLTLTGDGSTMFAFDPAEPSGSDDQKVYRALEIR